MDGCVLLMVEIKCDQIPVLCSRPRTDNLSPVCVSTLALVTDLIARRTKRELRARPRTSSANTVCFLHAPCHDYLADERIVHARRIRGRTGWMEKVREEEDDDRGVEEERKAHTRAWFPVTAVHTARRGPV